MFSKAKHATIQEKVEKTFIFIGGVLHVLCTRKYAGNKWEGECFAKEESATNKEKKSA